MSNTGGASGDDFTKLYRQFVLTTDLLSDFAPRAAPVLRDFAQRCPYYTLSTGQCASRIIA